MKIYTYYEDINFQEQDELLQLWKKSWERQGYEAIVLNREHCTGHPYYKEFIEELKKLHLEIINKDLTKYGLSCYLRWMAYATQPDEPFYVSDYDVINNSFPVQIPGEGLKFLDGFCPSLASGKPKNFEVLCKLFVEVTTEQLETLKQKNITPWYHDQEFLFHNFNYINPKHEIQCLRSSQYYAADIVENIKDYQLIHFSHRCCHEYSTTIPRTEVVKQICAKHFNI